MAERPVAFSRQDAVRIADVVRRIEAEPRRGVPAIEHRRWRNRGGSNVFVIEINGRPESPVNARHYLCNVYADVFATAITVADAQAMCVQHADTETIPDDSRFLAVRQRIDDVDWYVFEVPRDL